MYIKDIKEDAMDDRSNLTPELVAAWLKILDRDSLHNESWPEVNKRFHGIARAARPYIQKHFKPEEQKAAFDGLTLALAAIARFEDITALDRALGQPVDKSSHDTAHRQA